MTSGDQLPFSLVPGLSGQEEVDSDGKGDSDTDTDDGDTDHNATRGRSRSMTDLYRSGRSMVAKINDAGTEPSPPQGS